jgi:hypothetical protein
MSFNINLGNAAGANLGAGRATGAGCGSIFGFLWGLVLIPLSFGLVYYGEAKLVNHGVVFARTEMVSVEQAATTPGLVKFKGRPEGEFLRAERFKEPVIYWRKSLEEYESERDSDGDVSYSWNTKSSERHWADFRISDIKIVGEKANPVGERTIFEGVRRLGAGDFKPENVDSSPQEGDERLTIEVIEAGPELIVLGEVIDKTCSSGSSFVISALNEPDTEAALRLEYKIMYWVIKGGAVLMLWFGMITLFGPLMAMVGWIPWLGNRITGALTFSLLLVALVFVGVATIAIKFFWVIAGVAVGAILLLVVRGVTSPREDPRWQSPPPPMMPPPAAPLPPPPPPPPPA